jgi:simple sugar transport system permease protein
MNIWLNFLIDSVAFGATFIYGSTGEILTEKAGHLNLGIPGVMCMGGAGGCLILNMIGKSGLPPFMIVLLGMLGSVLFSVLCGLIYSFLTVSLRANQNVTGLALTTFGVGLMKVIMIKLDATVYLVGPKEYYRWPFAARQETAFPFSKVMAKSSISWLFQDSGLTATSVPSQHPAFGEVKISSVGMLGI